MSIDLDITISDFKNICRTCLSREKLQPLYQTYSQSTSSPSTCPAEMLMACTIITFTEDDGLPVKICTNCIYEINQAFLFAKRCETTDGFLRKCVKKYETELANNSSQSQTVESITKAEEVTENVKQKEDMKIQHEEIKQEELIIKNEYHDFADETYSETSINKDRLKDDGSPPCQTRNKHLVNNEKSFKKVSTFDGLKKHAEEIEHPPSNFYENNYLVQNKHAQYSEPLDQIYQCKICGRPFRRLVLLKAHEMIHTEQKNENDYDETNEGPTDEIYEEDLDEDQDETYSEKSGSVNSQIEEESSEGSVQSSQDADDLAKRLDLWKDHQQEEKKDETPFVCSVCSKAFIHLHDLKHHMRIHTEEQPHKCGICNKSFTLSALLKQHMSIHSGKKSYTCGVCDKVFSQLSNLKRHTRLHTGEKPHTCGVCSKAFAWETDFKRHMSIHTGEKAYTCEICSRTFAWPSDIKRHMNVHTGEKPYTCGVCSVAFAQPNSLKVHMRIHTGEKPHTCGICKKGFVERRSLKKHMSIHTGKKPYSCGMCNKAFTISSQLKRHMRIHTREALM